MINVILVYHSSQFNQFLWVEIEAAPRNCSISNMTGMF